MTTINMTQIVTEKMTEGQLSSTIKRIERQIDEKIATAGEAPEYLYTRLEKYTFAYVIRFNRLPQ